MNFARCFVLSVLLVVVSGCRIGERLTAVPPARVEAEQEIRGRIDSIRRAILAKDAAGIVQHGTVDWVFRAPDGTSYDRAAYLRRAEALFATMEIEALQTRVDAIEFVDGETARVGITQTMVRQERTAGATQRVRLVYAEQQLWVRQGGGWRVRQVTMLAPPQRQNLP